MVREQISVRLSDTQQINFEHASTYAMEITYHYISMYLINILQSIQKHTPSSATAMESQLFNLQGNIYVMHV